MARSRVFWRICFGWCLLLCLLPTVEAGTKSVNVPSIADQVSSGTSSVSNGTLTLSTAIEGEFIPGPTKNVPVRGILGGTEFGLNTIKGATRGLIRGAVPGIIGSLALDGLLKGLDWVMKDGAVVKKEPGLPAAYDPQGDEYFWTTDTGAVLIRYSSPSGACSALADTNGMSLTQTYQVNSKQYLCYMSGDDGVSHGLGPATQHGSVCPSGTDYNASSGICTSTGFAPITDQDFIKMDTWIDNQDSDWIRGLLKQQCVGSLNPNSCYAGLRQRQLDLRGPKSVDAGTTTTKSTHANSDGTTSTTTTTTNNKYDIAYGPTSFTFNKSSTTTTSTDGKPGDTTTTTDEPSDEADPDDADEDSSDKTTPAPCSGEGCDGPKYEKLYEPTKDTKEKALDSYASRVKALPIVASVAGFFTVNASAGCPSWSTNVSFAVFASMFSYDLVFDFYCQPWFVSMAQYAKIVFSIVCAYLAFRQAILD